MSGEQVLESRFGLVDKINSPAKLRELDETQLAQLCDEIRHFLVTKVCKTGGHLGPNLGVVELTIALHLVFDSPRDPFIFDTGHQSYVHKILTGRANQFDSLRQSGGLSGYPSRQESEHDWIENSHASTSLSWAEGLAKGFQLTGQDTRTVVAVIGDGALTGGMAWEALNNIAIDENLPLVIVVNDNGRSYSPTVGGIPRQLSGIRTDPRYEETLDAIRNTLKRTPVIGGGMYDILHALKAGMKDILAPQSMFSDLGIKYLGPVDGHDISALVTALTQAKGFGAPVIVHAITNKGKGFKAAEEHSEDLFHSVGKIDDVTGQPLNESTNRSWTEAFGEELVKLAAKNPKIVAVTAAMLHPVGLAQFAQRFPDRCFDVGIAEQHAVTSAAGLAMAGLHPVVAIYSTFLNRGFDQLLMDVGLHHSGVTFVLDRAGITGTDGASHNGMWDASITGIVPGLKYCAPRDEIRLRQALNKATQINDAPSVIRFSKDKMPSNIPAVKSINGIDYLRKTTSAQILLVGYGQFVELAIQVSDLLAAHGITADVIDPLWALPVNQTLIEICASYRLVATIEDNLVIGGLGSQLELALDEYGSLATIRHFGIPQNYLAAASRSEILENLGLTAKDISRSLLGIIAQATNDDFGDQLTLPSSSTKRS